MTITIDQGIKIESPNTALIDGTVSSAKGVGGVEIFEGGNDVGAAAVKPDGTWSFDAFYNNLADLTAILTDGSGGKETSNQLSIITDTPLDGQVASAQKFSDGSSAFTVFGKGGRALYDGTSAAPTGADAEAFITGRGGSSIAYSGFVVGHETVTNFRATGPNHDTLNVSNTSGFASMKDVLAHTTTNAGSATIHFDDHTSVTLTGISSQQLAAHPHDVIFTGGHGMA